MLTAATVKYASGGLQYEFEIYDAANTRLQSAIVSDTTWRGAALDYAKRYTWRARARLGDNFGPWSAFASFVTPDSRGYLRGNELYDPLWTGTTIGRASGTTFVLGQGIRLDGIESFVEWRLEQPLVDGQFSAIITNLGNSNEQWKTKVMSMLQGDGVNVTDNAFRFTADRRNADSGGTVRYTLRSRGVDAGEPNAGGMRWDRTKLYLWTYTWSNGQSRLEVREGGANGPVVKSVGASYRAPYAPNPHLIRLGSVGGRAGSETLPGAVIRNVWVSANPRPAFPNDNP